MSHAWLIKIKIRNYFSLKKKKHEKTGILCNNEKSRFDQSESKHLILLLILYVHLLKYTVTAKNEPQILSRSNG